jgi:site-specific DNA recombinase
MVFMPKNEVLLGTKEVIGERVRDKIAASKRKGLWVGGPVPLRLSLHRQEARDRSPGGGGGVHHLHPLSGAWLHGALLTELDRQGIRTKINGRRDGRRSGGIRFGVGSLAHLLKNRFYIGEVVYRGEVHCGEHEPILGRDLFEAVQARRAANMITSQTALRQAAIVESSRDKRSRPDKRA